MKIAVNTKEILFRCPSIKRVGEISFLHSRLFAKRKGKIRIYGNTELQIYTTFQVHDFKNWN